MGVSLSEKNAFADNITVVFYLLSSCHVTCLGRDVFPEVWLETSERHRVTTGGPVETVGTVWIRTIAMLSCQFNHLTVQV